FEAFRPLDAKERGAILDAVLGPAQAHPEVAPGSPGVIPYLRPFLRRRRTVLVAALAPLAAAAALIVSVSRSQPVLPEYAASVEGGQSEMRGSPPAGAPIVLGPEARLR